MVDLPLEGTIPAQNELACRQYFEDNKVKAFGYMYNTSECSLIKQFRERNLIQDAGTIVKLYGANAGIQFTISYWIKIQQRMAPSSSENTILICKPETSDEFLSIIIPDNPALLASTTVFTPIVGMSNRRSWPDFFSLISNPPCPLGVFLRLSLIIIW